MKAKYINPFTDFGFKKIFGEEASKELLIDFLNALIPQANKIIDLKFKNTEHLGLREADRYAIFDIYCENEKGEKFIVELQKAKQSYFKDRTLFYATFPIQEQAKQNDWDFKLKAVYTVAILDFVFEKESFSSIFLFKIDSRMSIALLYFFCLIYTTAILFKGASFDIESVHSFSASL